MISDHLMAHAMFQSFLDEVWKGALSSANTDTFTFYDHIAMSVSHKSSVNYYRFNNTGTLL